MKTIFVFILILCCPLLIFCQKVDTELAKKVAVNFSAKRKAQNGDMSYRSVMKLPKIKNVIEKKFNGHPSFYINNIEGGGWVVVSGNKALGPVLAYSDFDSMNMNDIPDVFWDWMKQYEVLVDSAFVHKWQKKSKQDKWNKLESYIISSTPKFIANSIANTVANTNYTVGKFLITTRWGQGKTTSGECPAYNSWMPINNRCDDCSRCLAGCTAVAMAQILNYWGFSFGTSADFNWWHMPEDQLMRYLNSNYDNEQKSVSYLLKRCGDLNGMSYCWKGCLSGAWPEREAFMAMGYSDMVDIEKKFWHTNNAWINMLKEEIDNLRPVLYYNDEHSLVCDGYDEDNKFHFNYGVDGSSNCWVDFEDLEIDGAYTDISEHQCVRRIVPLVLNNIILSNTTISSMNLTYQANSEINIAGNNSNFIINNSAKCRFLAGNKVSFKPGFKISSGGEMLARIYRKETLNESISFIAQSEEDLTIVNKQPNFEYSESLRIYPNPVFDNIYISGFDCNCYDVQVSVYNLMGERILRCKLNRSEEKQVNLSSLNKGIYNITIQYENNFFHQKIIKE